MESPNELATLPGPTTKPRHHTACPPPKLARIDHEKRILAAALRLHYPAKEFAGLEALLPRLTDGEVRGYWEFMQEQQKLFERMKRRREEGEVFDAEKEAEVGGRRRRKLG